MSEQERSKRGRYKQADIGEEYAGNPDFCKCEETVLLDPETRNPYRVPKPKYHSCDYIARVNAHLFEAAVQARRGPPDMWPNLLAKNMNHYRRQVVAEMDAEARASAAKAEARE